MAITPVEIRHVSLGGAMIGGYRREATDRLLADVADSYETVWRERADLADTVDRLEQDLVRYRELETLLRTTLVSAERAAQELKEQAQREAQLIVDAAHAEARNVLHAAVAERERLLGETRRIRSLLRSTLDVLVDAEGGSSRAEAA